jgi:mRNA interferase HicA
MKRRDLIRKLEELGCVLVRHGASHDWYTNPSAKKSQPVPRHSEIHDGLAKSIIRKLSKDVPD